MTSREIAPLRAEDYSDWRQLWDAYCAFYQVTLDPAAVDGLWHRLHDPMVPIHGLLARDASGHAIGLVQYVLHPHTWSLKTVCYLEDLYVAADARGGGVGRALIQHLRALADAQGWGRIYWRTDVGNRTAQRLYDAVATKAEVLTYQINC